MSILSKFLPSRRSSLSVSPKTEIRASQSVATKWTDMRPPTVTIYPPVDPGLPAVSTEEILAAAQTKIRRLADIAGGSESEFERLYISALRNLAAQIHLLPASPYQHYSAPAGLFNMCLDIGLMSRQAAEGKIFVPEATIEVRHKTEGAWRYAAFLAGLMSQLHVPVGSMTVTDEKGDQWPRYGSSIADWLKDKQLDRYFVTWHEKARVTGAEGASLLTTVVPRDVMDWLAVTDSQIIRDLNIAVTREMNSTESILGAIIKSVTARVKEVDALHQPSRFGRLTVGTQFEIHALNAMRELIETKIWTCNDAAGVLFWGSDGLYVAWPKGLNDVLDVFEQRGLSAMPKSSVTIAEILGLSGVIISKEAGVWVHDIVVKIGGDAKVISAMRFKDPVVLLGHLPLQAVTHPFGKVLVDAQDEQLALQVQNRIEAPAAPKSGPKASQVEGAPDTSPVSAPARPESLKVAPVVAVEQTQQKSSEPVVPKQVPSPTAVPAMDTGVAHIDHVEDVLPGKRVPIAVIQRLKIRDTEDCANALGMVIEEGLRYRADRVRVLDWGVAICVKWLTSVAGYAVGDLAGPLERIGVIARDPNSSKSIGLISEVVFADSPNPRTALAIKLTFAEKLGIPTDAKV